MKKKIYKIVETALNKAVLHYGVDDEGMIFQFTNKGNHANFDERLICDEKMDFLMAIVSCSMFVAEKIDRMFRWVAEKNYGFTLGNFKLDTSDGGLTFRITCPLDKSAVNEDIVACKTLSTFDNNYEDITRTIYLDNGSGKEF